MDQTVNGMSRFLELVHNGVNPHEPGSCKDFLQLAAKAKQAGWVRGDIGTGPYQLTPNGLGELVNRIAHYGVPR